MGFAFENTSQSTVYVRFYFKLLLCRNSIFHLQVATNGYISFGQRITSIQNPSLFNESNTLKYIVAPYWSDIDTRSTGSVSYELHTNRTSLLLLHKVSKYIRQREQNNFAGIWMLVAEWNSIPSPGMYCIA